MQARIRKVQEMLSSPGNSSLTDIAAMAGFSDQAHLSRVFKMIVGVTPSAWIQATSAQAQ